MKFFIRLSLIILFSAKILLATEPESDYSSYLLRHCYHLELMISAHQWEQDIRKEISQNFNIQFKGDKNFSSLLKFYDENWVRLTFEERKNNLNDFLVQGTSETLSVRSSANFINFLDKKLSYYSSEFKSLRDKLRREYTDQKMLPLPFLEPEYVSFEYSLLDPISDEKIDQSFSHYIFLDTHANKSNLSPTILENTSVKSSDLEKMGNQHPFFHYYCKQGIKSYLIHGKEIRKIDEDLNVMSVKKKELQTKISHNNKNKVNLEKQIKQEKEKIQPQKQIPQEKVITDFLDSMENKNTTFIVDHSNSMLDPTFFSAIFSIDYLSTKMSKDIKVNYYKMIRGNYNPHPSSEKTLEDIVNELKKEIKYKEFDWLLPSLNSAINDSNVSQILIFSDFANYDYLNNPNYSFEKGLKTLENLMLQAKDKGIKIYAFIFSSYASIESMANELRLALTYNPNDSEYLFRQKVYQNIKKIEELSDKFIFMGIEDLRYFESKKTFQQTSSIANPNLDTLKELDQIYNETVKNTNSLQTELSALEKQAQVLQVKKKSFR